MKIVVSVVMEIVRMLQKHMDPKIAKKIFKLPWRNLVCEKMVINVLIENQNLMSWRIFL